jgi:hypothetical protein
MKPPNQSHIVIAGAARDIGKTLAKQVKVFDRAFRSFKKISYLIVESDSTDDTVALMESLQQTVQDFGFISEGVLEPLLPLRTQRIAHARAVALEHCLNSAGLATVDYVAVADWDGVNLSLSPQAVLSCWEAGGWEVACANQPGGYYDVWALRHRTWCPGDCWEEYRKLCVDFGDATAHQIAIAARRIRIPRTHALVDVDSAFGGLAIYQAAAYFSSRYKMPECDSAETCEHVEFHRGIKAAGGRIVINPALVNIESLDDLLPRFSARRTASALKRLVGDVSARKRNESALNRLIDEQSPVEFHAR